MEYTFVCIHFSYMYIYIQGKAVLYSQSLSQLWVGYIQTLKHKTCIIYMYFITGKHFQEAIDHYTKAIELNPTVAVYYGNRSFAHMKMESYGFALADANKALELDKTYIKVTNK